MLPDVPAFSQLALWVPVVVSLNSHCTSPHPKRMPSKKEKSEEEKNQALKEAVQYFEDQKNRQRVMRMIENDEEILEDPHPKRQRSNPRPAASSTQTVE